MKEQELGLGGKLWLGGEVPRHPNPQPFWLGFQENHSLAVKAGDAQPCLSL